MFVPIKPVQRSLRFTSKVRTYPSGASYSFSHLGKAFGLTYKQNLDAKDWKGQTLSEITTVKSFITLAPGVDVRKLFSSSPTEGLNKLECLCMTTFFSLEQRQTQGQKCEELR